MSDLLGEALALLSDRPGAWSFLPVSKRKAVLAAARNWHTLTNGPLRDAAREWATFYYDNGHDEAPDGLMIFFASVVDALTDTAEEDA